MTERFGHLLAALLVLFAVLIIAMIAAIVANPVYGHDHEHPENNACLAGLENKSGVSCCDGADATRVDEAEWDAKDGHYRVELEGEWVDVPDSALIKDGHGCPGPTRVWTMHLNGKLYPRCFAPGAGG